MVNLYRTTCIKLRPDSGLISSFFLSHGNGRQFGTGQDSLLSISLKQEIPSVDSYFTVLKGCKELKDISRLRLVHLNACINGLDSHHIIGNDIVCTYMESGSLLESQLAFDRLPFRSVHSWTSLIWGYVQSQEWSKLFFLYEAMIKDGVTPSCYTFVPLLKACSESMDKEKGQVLHNHIIKFGLQSNSFVSSTLVDMYAKFSLPNEASELFSGMPNKDVVSWSVLIAAYAQTGHVQDVVECYHCMWSENIAPNAVTFLSILKVCSTSKDLFHGQEFHKEVLLRGFDRDTSVGNAIVYMYVKCGSLNEAKQVFDLMAVQDSVSWNTIIAGYAEEGLSLESLEIWEIMQVKDVQLNETAIVCVLKSCGNIPDINKGQKLHLLVVKVGFEQQIYVGNALIDMYSKCGFSHEARNIFDNLLYRDIVSWNSLIASHTEDGRHWESLLLFEKMRAGNIFQDSVTYVSVLKACGNTQSIETGMKIHSEVTFKALDDDLVVGGMLIDMYVNCAALSNAQKVFDNLPSRNVVLWNTIIAGYVEHMFIYEAIECFKNMQIQGITPNASTYAYVLKAYSCIGAVEQGRVTHMRVEKIGLENDSVLGSMLVEMYVKFGLLNEAQTVFKNLEHKSIISWNVLISGYSEHGPSESTFHCLKCMQEECFSPDSVTFSSVIKACVQFGLNDTGSSLHRDIICKGFETEYVTGSALVDMYSKFGFLANAKKVLDKMPVRSIVPWNTLLAAYVEYEAGEEAFQCFTDMQEVGLSVDTVSLICKLKACIITAALDKGRDTHNDILLRGLETEHNLGSGLVDMYAKCGSLSEAQDVYDDLHFRNVVVLNTMIQGYGMNHQCEIAIKLFEDMQGEGSVPDSATFTCLLTACTRSSLVSKGQELFKMMKETYGITPTLDHLSCMVDLLGRSGHLSEAERFLKTMPHNPASDSQRALLTASKTFEKPDLGERCFTQLT